MPKKENNAAIRALRDLEERCISLLEERADSPANAKILWEQSHWHKIVSQMIAEYSTDDQVRGWYPKEGVKNK